jgi:hypothetical protein
LGLNALYGNEATKFRGKSKIHQSPHPQGRKSQQDCQQIAMKSSGE